MHSIRTAAALACLALTGPASANGDFEITAYTVSAGGGSSTGGAFTVVGVVGQTSPIGRSTGGAFELQGGLLALETRSCPADLTTTGATIPGIEGFLIPDGVASLDDLGVYLNAWLALDAALADVTTSGSSIAGFPGFGVPDGVVDLDDLGFFLNAWLQGCP